ncbi:MAG: hypothetical protein WDW38_004044 [Sanguina aurantia]
MHPAVAAPVDFERLLNPASRALKRHSHPGSSSSSPSPPASGHVGTTDRLPDIVWGPGKSADQIAAALVHLTSLQRIAMAVRIEPEMYAAVRKHAPGVEYNARSRTLVLRSPLADTLPKQERLPGSVCVVSGGTADLGVAEECKVTAEHLGCYCFRITDVSVSELGKLLTNLDALRAADALVVICGTDAALPSVLAGLVDVPVIAVPTSAGFGASLGGIAPLLASLTSSAPGVTVANIDHGVGAAQTVTRMLRMASRLHLARREAEHKAAATAAVLAAFAEESDAVQRLMEETVKAQHTQA